MIFRLCTLFLMLAYTSMAYAYIPPSHFIVGTWVKSRKSMKPLRIRARITAYDGDQPTSIRFKEILYFNPETQSLDSFAATESNGEPDKIIFATARKLLATQLPAILMLGSDVATTDEAFNLAGIPIQVPVELPQPTLPTESANAEALHTTVQPLPQSPPEKLGLIRMGQHMTPLAWVIGTSQPKSDITTPQVWFEKDKFLPRKLIFLSNQKPTKQLTEISFESYQNYLHLPFPKITKFKTNPNDSAYYLVEILDITSVNHHELSHLGNIPKDNISVIASDSVRNLVQLYYSSFR